MDKLNMETKNITQENIKTIKQFFPSVVTEVVGDDGKTKLAVDFDSLKQELSEVVVEGKQERYQMTWPDKKKSIILANSKITDTLRPVREKSVDFDNTKNLYIEGDNLDVLKLLRETYLGKIKMIYIDPPYNTGNDFVYKDKFASSAEEYLSQSGQYDEEGNILVQNLSSDGRYHTNWLNMMYPRLRIAKDLLDKDGVIFISIDDNEQANLKKICDEIFGEGNFITKFVWEKTQHFGRQKLNSYSNADYVLCYAKNLIAEKLKKLLVEYVNTELQDAPLYNASNNKNKLKFPAGTVKFNMPDGVYAETTSEDYKLINPVNVVNSLNENDFELEFKSRWSNTTVQEEIKNGTTFWVKTQSFAIRAVYGEGKSSTVSPKQILFTNSKNEFCAKDRNGIKINTSENATGDLEDLMGMQCFSYPKPVSLILYFINLLYSERKGMHESDFIFMDFFSGSGTSAHATILANALDSGKRKFIMVQYPENLDEALKKASKNSKEIVENAIALCDQLKQDHYLTEIGEERIRRAGKKIKEEYPEAANLDVGFRVLKLDSSNMQDVYYNPKAMQQSLLDSTVDNIKEDRTPEDLLFQVMISLGIDLTSKIAVKTIAGKNVYYVNDNDIVACFDDNLTNDVIVEIAKLEPMYAVFKDKSFATDSVGINNEQLFKIYAKDKTTIKVL